MNSKPPPVLNARQLASLENGEYNFFVTTRRALMRTDEVASVIGRGTAFVRHLVEDGRLEAHSDSAIGERHSFTVTRRSVILYLVKISNYDPAYTVMLVEVILRALKTPALERLIAFATKLKNQI